MKDVIEHNASEMKRRHRDKPRKNDPRGPFEIDRSRIIHSTAFRRMQGKTQVFGLTGSDFFRTRLTHSLETAQIGKGIALRLRVNTDLVEAACLAHDIGHPPFGHAGEATLAELMKAHGGFEANAQNIRVLEKIEIKLPNCTGLNLTRGTWDAILKYKTSFSKAESEGKKKFYYDEDQKLVDWIATGAPNSRTRSFECCIMEWADDIAYSAHDLEDGIKSGLINPLSIENALFKKKLRNKWESEEGDWSEKNWRWCLGIIQSASGSPSNVRKYKAHRKEAVAQIINSFVRATKLKKNGRTDLPPRYQYSLQVDPVWKSRCNLLKAIVWEAIIANERFTTLARKAKNIITSLFEDFTDWKNDSSQLLPQDFRERFDKGLSRTERYRLVCDYISGMTDRYAARIYSRLREAEESPLFDIL